MKAQGASVLPLDRLALAREWLAHYAGACVGKRGIDVLVKGLSQAILARGYVTTRVLVPEQDLSTSTLKLSLIPGVIRHIRFADETLRGTWKTAFPTRDGELLNLRDLEQGLEQMKRVSGQDVSMQIVPADMPGESDVVLDVKRSKPWTVVASIDNSGTRATGRLQGNLSLGIDNPLGLNDLFNIGMSQDLERRQAARLARLERLLFDPVGLLDRDAVGVHEYVLPADCRREPDVCRKRQFEDGRLQAEPRAVAQPERRVRCAVPAVAPLRAKLH